MATIEDLLQRRTDLSTFLIHLTRDFKDGLTARENLLAMIDGEFITARSPFGPARDYEPHLEGSAATQKVVCFTETPLEHAWMMLEDIENRTVHFQPYGLALTKTTAREADCNPVWYSHMALKKGTFKHFPIASINALIQDAVQRSRVGDTIDSAKLGEEPIFKLTPFFEQMGYTPDTPRKEFWWEREWRHIGDFNIGLPGRIVAVLAPAHDHVKLREDLTEIHEDWGKRPILDPRWGLERMLVAMSGIKDKHIGPFPKPI